MMRGGPELADGGLPFPSGLQALMVKAAIGPDDGVADAFRSWREQVDIDDHMDGGTYRLLPMVYDRMRKLGIDDPLMGRMKGVYRRAWVETHGLFHDVLPMVAKLEAAGVRTMMLKGVPLALTYYQSHATRPMFDLDLLVPSEQRDLALEVMREAGWKTGWIVKPHELVDQHGLDHHGPGGREIDLHWHCLREAPSKTADAWFWKSAQPFDFVGVKTMQPGPTAMVLHLIIHGLRSNVEPPIRWILDSATVIRANPDLDWDDMVAFAKSQRLSHRLYLGLDYLASEYGVPVPPRVLRDLKSAGVSLVERIENVVYLGRAETAYRPMLFPLIDYWRYLRNQSAWTFVGGFGAYLQRRWKLGHPLQIPLAALKVLGRRAVRAPART